MQPIEDAVFSLCGSPGGGACPGEERASIPPPVSGGYFTDLVSKRRFLKSFVFFFKNSLCLFCVLLCQKNKTPHYLTWIVSEPFEWFYS